jgi:hypothetical protein
MGGVNPVVTAAVPAPSAGQAAAGSEHIYEQILDKYSAINREVAKRLNKAEVSAALAEALSNGELTRDEFNDIFQAHMTEEAWNAFVGHNEQNEDGEYVIKTGENNQGLKNLLHYFEEFQEFNQAVPEISFAYFSRCTRITIISEDQMANFLSGLDGQAIDALIRSNAEILKSILYYAEGRMYNDVEGEDLYAELKADLAGLLAAAKFDAKSREWVGLIGIAIFNRLQNAAKEEGIRLDKLDLRDPLVCRRFLNDVFKPYITGENGISDITGEQYDAIKEFSEQIEKLRGMINGNQQLGDLLDNVDYNSDKFKEVIRLLEEGVEWEGEGGIKAALEACPRIETQPPADMAATPAVMGTAPNQIPVVDPESLTPPAEEEPVAAATGSKVYILQK